MCTKKKQEYAEFRRASAERAVSSWLKGREEVALRAATGRWRARALKVMNGMIHASCYILFCREGLEGRGREGVRISGSPVSVSFVRVDVASLQRPVSCCPTLFGGVSPTFFVLFFRALYLPVRASIYIYIFPCPLPTACEKNCVRTRVQQVPRERASGVCVSRAPAVL